MTKENNLFCLLYCCRGALKIFLFVDWIGLDFIFIGPDKDNSEVREGGKTAGGRKNKRKQEKMHL